MTAVADEPVPDDFAAVARNGRCAAKVRRVPLLVDAVDPAIRGALDAAKQRDVALRRVALNSLARQVGHRPRFLAEQPVVVAVARLPGGAVEGDGG